MELKLFKTLWGHQGDVHDAVRLIREAGFHGIEGPLPVSIDRRGEFIDVLREQGLLYIAEISTTGYAVPDPGSTVAQHLDAFERTLDRNLEASPIFCTAMAGSDLWLFGESVDFLTRAHAIALDRGARIGFETHRSRSLFHPIITRELLKEVPPIELTIDFSHWCVVTERLVLDELPDLLDLCAGRVLHIQPRVGYAQGPQVPDPRAPEYFEPVESHFRWWHALWNGQRDRGFETITMTPEFGPDGYLQVEPFTQRPSADVWELNSWIGHRLTQQFRDWNSGPAPAISP